MKKEFLINIALLVVINLIVKLGYLFFIEVEVQNTLGPEQYGLFLALFNFSYLFQFINDPGLHSYNSTSIASGEKEVSGQLEKIIGLKLVLSLLFLGAVFLGGTWIGYGSSAIMYLLMLISVNQVLSTAFMFLRSTLSASGHYRQDSIISALDKVIMIFLLGYLLFMATGTLELQDFIMAQMMAYAISCFVVIGLLFSKKVHVYPSFNFSDSMTLLRKASPYALILLLMASYNKMDGVMLERLLDNGDYQAGIYAASLRYMDAANMGAYLFAALLLPMFASVKDDFDQIRSLCDVGFRLMIVAISMVAITGIIYRTELMSIYDAFDPQYNQLLIYHLLSFACVGISYIYGTLLTSTKKLKKMNYVLLIGLIVNLVLNLMLIPEFKAVGAARATLITQAVVMIGQVTLAANEFALKKDVKLIGKTVLFVVISILAASGSYVLFQKPWIFGAIISVMMIGILSLLLGIVRKDMIFAWVK
jgi:O-antigen/teichoic acid export membrane protein